MPHLWLVRVTIGLATATALTVLLHAPVLEHSRRTSPDGAYVAVARTAPLHSIFAVMPGQGSDKPGKVTLYRGNKSCGAALLPMVSFLYDLQWTLDALPRRAEIRLVAIWNLDDCSLERVFGD